MATLALAAVGAAVGGSLLPAGVGFLGATLSAPRSVRRSARYRRLRRQRAVRRLGQSRAIEGPRLSDLKVTASTEGSPLPRI